MSSLEETDWKDLDKICFGKKVHLFIFFRGKAVFLSLQRSEVSFQPRLSRLHLLWNFFTNKFLQIGLSLDSLSVSPADEFDWESSACLHVPGH